MIPLEDIDRISLRCHCKYVVKELCLAAFRDPEYMKRFEEWKAARDAEAAKEGETA